MKQLRAIFSGAVQGVGFRYITERMARPFPVTGFVKNLRDGKVELVAEGREEVLEKFLAAVRESQLKHYIQDVEINWSEPTGEFTKFEIAV